MKKIIFIGALLISIFSFASCSSTNVVSDETSVEESADKTGKKNKKNKKKNENIDSEVIESSKKEVTLKSGIVRVKVKPKFGTYNISVSDEDEKLIQVLSAANEYTTTNISLKVNRKIYSLMAAPNVNCKVTKKDGRLLLNYNVDDVAEVTLAMDFIQSDPERDIDMVKCTITVKNIGKKKTEFTVKQILDTILGEKSDNHFYSCEDSPIKNEVLLRNLTNQKWFVSRNESTSMQLLFNGGDTSAPELFVLANYATLDSGRWEPDMTTYRSFDTVLSYNNSAVGVIWPPVKLLSGESADFVYYLAFATDGEKPYGDRYVYGLSTEKELPLPKTEPVVENAAPEEDFDTVEVKNTYEENYEPKVPETVEFNVKKLSSEKYTPEYIQGLLNRIAELEKDSASVNREELLKLNQELDEILEALRE